MRKLPKDIHGNEGWAVRARKYHRCIWGGVGCKGIAPDAWYYRAVAWPRTDIKLRIDRCVELHPALVVQTVPADAHNPRHAPGVLMPTPEQSDGAS